MLRQLYAAWLKADAYARGYLRKERSKSKIRSWLLWTSTLFSAAVGTTVFASFETSVDSRIKFIVGLMAFVAAMLTTANKITEPGADIGKCQTARVGYGEIRDKAAGAYSKLKSQLITLSDAQEVLDTVAANEATIKNGVPPVLSDEEWDEAYADAKEQAVAVLGVAPEA